MWGKDTCCHFHMFIWSRFWWRCRSGEGDDQRPGAGGSRAWQRESEGAAICLASCSENTREARGDARMVVGVLGFPDGSAQVSSCHSKEGQRT